MRAQPLPGLAFDPWLRLDPHFSDDTPGNNLMGQPYHLRCLGRPQLISPGGEPVRFRVRKHVALLIYLALEPRIPHRREKLADLLWGSGTPNEGRHSLATAASVIRGKLGREVLVGDRDHLRLATINLTLDLDRLAAGDLFGDEFRTGLAIGGFLQDFEVADAHEFMLWTDRQRARWVPVVRDALVRMIDRCRRTGDFKRIESIGHNLLDIDELSEDGIRARMEARAFDGDRLTSLKIYEAWKAKLDEQLHATPSPLVEGIAIRLRRRDWETVSTNIPTVPTDQWRGRPFIGRAEEYRALYESWENTMRRYPHHALVLGDSGVGKSTLIERVGTAAGLEGAALSRVSCYEVEREIPYAAITGLVAGLLDRPGVSGTPPEWLAELSRTVPEIRRRYPSIPDPLETQGETARLRLTEAFQQLTLSIAEEHPVILIIDDVHLADDASLAVLHLVMRRTQDQRIMVLLAARPAELGQSPHAAWLREGHAPLRMQILDLPPMSPQESDDLLVILLPSDRPQPSAAVRRALLHASAGYPMVLEYLVQDWETNGEQCLALSIGAMTEEPRTADGPSLTYKLIVQRLVQGLEPSVRNVLNMASVLGSRVNDIDLYSLADVTIGQTMTGLGKLTDMRILRDGGRGLEFCNELVRGQAYLQVPSPVRRTLHRSIAERLLAQEQQGISIPGLEIAWHCIRGGLLERATPYLLSGAREAIRHGAPHEAERALVTALGDLKEPKRTDAQLLLAEALHEQGRWEDTLAVLSSQPISPSDPRATAAFVLSVEAKRRLSIISADSTDDLIVHLLRIAQADSNIATRVQAFRSAAYLQVYVPIVPSLSTQMACILLSFEGLILSDEDYATVTVASGILHYHAGRTDQAIQELECAAQRLDDRHSANTVAVAVHEALGNIHAAVGSYEHATAHHYRAFVIAKHVGNERMSSRVAANLVRCSTRLGQYREAVTWLGAALEHDGHRKTDDLSHCLYHGAVATAILGREGETRPVLEQLQQIAGTTDSLRIRQNCLLFLADCLLLLGRTHEAMGVAKAATSSSLERLQSPNTAGLFARWVAFLACSNSKKEVPPPRLQKMFENRNTYDRIDRTEILCAVIVTGNHLGQDTTGLEEILRRELETLPPAVGQFLERLGFMPARKIIPS